ncbi:phage tail terminator-like protein [Frigidibacter sp. MR17.24]|uniref:phage tail terminator-like protein n=1 Tax=Frigidibacter sp. MR17.24 TaxID=3127345 RepID=UPI003012D22C
MATVEGNIHAALMARVATLPGFALFWPEQGQTRPTTEHVEVRHLPNRPARQGLSGGTVLERRGFILLALVSELGAFDAVYRERAGQIAEHFPRDFWMTSEGVRMRVHAVEVSRGFEDSGMWRTPVSVDYRGFA